MADDLTSDVIEEGLRLDAARTPGEWLAEHRHADGIIT